MARFSSVSGASAMSVAGADHRDQQHDAVVAQTGQVEVEAGHAGVQCIDVWPVSVRRRVASVLPTKLQPLPTVCEVVPVGEFSTSLTAAVHGTLPLNQVLLSLQLAAFLVRGSIHFSSVTRTSAPSRASRPR